VQRRLPEDIGFGEQINQLANSRADRVEFADEAKIGR
jgi:hypothetical protein